MEKRQVRSLERECRNAYPSSVAAVTAAWMARRRAYRDLLRLKRELFWTAKVDSENSRPYQLWQSTDKVEGVRASTSSAPSPTFTGTPPGCSLHRFELLTDDDIIMAVRQLPNKHCLSDPVPTTLLRTTSRCWHHS